MGFGEFETPLKELEIKCNFFTVAELKLAGWILRQADSNLHRLLLLFPLLLFLLLLLVMVRLALVQVMIQTLVMVRMNAV